MARLNEAFRSAATTTTATTNPELEQLKRDFVRQNKSFAKRDTQQSLRIRTLELDQSKLQTELLEARAEIVRLNTVLADRADDFQLSQLEYVKQDIQTRLLEINNAVIQLGNIKRPLQERRESIPSSWRPEVPLLRLGGTEPRMPSIDEDKSWPRLTIGADGIGDVVRLSSQSNDSPELGPPPIAHFDHVDPIKFDKSWDVNSLEQDDSCDQDGQQSVKLATNLENRRRRRSTAMFDEMRTDEMGVIEEARLAEERDLLPSDNKPRRVGVKRKLGARELDHRDIKPLEEKFAFVKRDPASYSQEESGVTVGVTLGKVSPNNEETESKTQALVNGPRKVLGEKSVNLSPQKPCNRKKSTKLDIDKNEKLTSKVKPRARKPRVSMGLTSLKVQPDLHVVATVPEEFDLQTPGTPSIDILSPTPSDAPSTSRGDSSESQNAAAKANLEGMVRPSRRARSTIVSYAEPSLNVKMRRPTSDMVDAVVIKAQSANELSGTVDFIRRDSQNSLGRIDWTDTSAKSDIGNNTARPSLLPTPTKSPSPSVTPTYISASPSIPIRGGSSQVINALKRVERPKSVSLPILQKREDGSDQVEQSDVFDISKHLESLRSGNGIKTRRHSLITSFQDVVEAHSSPSDDSSLVDETIANKNGRIRNTTNRRRSMAV